VDAYVEMGFTQFTLGFGGPGWDVDAGASWLAWRDRMNAAVRAPLDTIGHSPSGGHLTHG